MTLRSLAGLLAAVSLALIALPAPTLAGVQNRLWINDGAGRFTDETASRLPARTDQTQGFVPGDGDLDLLVGNSTSVGGAEALYIRQRSRGRARGDG